MPSFTGNTHTNTDENGCTAFYVFEAKQNNYITSRFRPFPDRTSVLLVLLWTDVEVSWTWTHM